MADFCEKCAEKMGFDKCDFDIEKELESLQIDRILSPYLCEGCGLKAVAKDKNGTCLYLYYGSIKWTPIRR